MGLLLASHTFLAIRRNEPHWLLSEADAKRYGQALANAARHFPVQVSQKAIDIGTLLLVFGEMEMPRLALSWQSMQAKARATAAQRTPQGQSATVMQFTRPQGPPSPSGQSAAAPGGSGASPPIADGPYDPGVGGDSFGPH